MPALQRNYAPVEKTGMSDQRGGRTVTNVDQISEFIDRIRVDSTLKEQPDHN